MKQEILIANAFSLNMLNPGSQAGNQPRIPRPCPDPKGLIAEANFLGYEIRSVVGHADTANVLGTILGREVAMNRETVILQPHQTLLVGQYSGPRLPEGATELPEGATITWWEM